MKKTNLSWVGALLVFALLLWCTAATPGTIADPASYAPAVYSSMLSLLPPVVAIVLALNTKEVYTSLLVGIATGALLFANGNLELAVTTLFFNEDGGMVAKLSDSSNVGILVFLVMLGILVALMNKAGGSAAFGRWASTHIHTRAGAQFATLILGVLIFVDDYFNCLTVGSVMRPVTDRQKVSRAKLAYLIDSTAAPVCIIAPVSSWAAAVTSSVPEGSGINGFTMFLRTIPYNYYALLTIVMSLFLIFTGTDYCSMKQHEDNARAGDLFTTADRPYGDDVDTGDDARGHVIDLVAPVLVLIAACILGLIYTGGFFEGVDFITAFSDCNASAGLVLGSSIALMFTFVFYRVRSVMTFQDFAACIPEGFKAMVSPMLILTLAWTLSGMTNLLGAKYYVANLLGGSAAAPQAVPAVRFVQRRQRFVRQRGQLQGVRLVCRCSGFYSLLLQDGCGSGCVKHPQQNAAPAVLLQLLQGALEQQFAVVQDAYLIHHLLDLAQQVAGDQYGGSGGLGHGSNQTAHLLNACRVQTVGGFV